MSDQPNADANHSNSTDDDTEPNEPPVVTVERRVPQAIATEAINGSDELVTAGGSTDSFGGFVQSFAETTDELCVAGGSPTELTERIELLEAWAAANEQ
jgi:hypothetical protein